MDDVTALLRIARQSSKKQIEAIHAGLPASTFTAMASYLGVSQGQLAGSLSILPRTLRNRASHGKLSQEESEKSLRVARLFAKARDILGGEKRAKEWITSPVKSLGGQKPIDLLETDIGAQDVMNVLFAIEWGVYL
jgi:putative toxin-antitoxin system antitoxin component (TIGR02293 family)